MLSLSLVCIVLIFCINQLQHQKQFQRKYVSEKDRLLLKKNLNIYNVNQWPKLSKVIDLTQNQLNEISTLMESMSLEQKIAQMIRVPFSSTYKTGFKTLNISDVYIKNASKSVSAKSLVKDHQQLIANLKTHSQDIILPYIPPFVCAKINTANHLDSDAVLFANDTAVNSANNDDLTYELGLAVAQQLLSSGINCIQYSNAYYSSNKNINNQHNKMYNQGLLKEKNLLNSLGMNLELLPKFHPYYNELIYQLNAGSLSVHISVSEIPKSKLKYNTVSVLKKWMGYEGLIIVDSELTQYIINGDENKNKSDENCWSALCQKLINLGVDVIVFDEDVELEELRRFINDTAELVNSNKIKLERINDAVRRILTVKKYLGLFEHNLNVTSKQQYEIMN